LINTERIDHLLNKITLCYGDITDGTSMVHILNKIKSKYDIDVLEIYNLAAQSHVLVSFELPEYTADVDANGTLKILEAIRTLNMNDKVKFYQASTSELYGKVVEKPQTELTPFYPRSPYAVAKLYSYWICKNYRESYNMFICNGILFNHESPRRAHNFVTRKITLGLNKICKGIEDKLVMGNINSLRDWGHARDYCYGMYLMLQQKEPDDFVLATGENHSIREFIEKAFALKNFNIKWKGEGINEIGYDANTGRELIFIDSKYYRPAEVEDLLGNPKKANEKLGWKSSTSFDDLVKEMVAFDCEN
jgi:GDPmannose 4,6-dehydratase